MFDSILKIQNGQKSLTWGKCERPDGTIFSVGHKSYPKQVRYVFVEKDLKVFDVTSGSPVLVRACKTVRGVNRVVCELLKEWFPVRSV